MHFAKAICKLHIISGALRKKAITFPMNSGQIVQKVWWHIFCQY